MCSTEVEEWVASLAGGGGADIALRPAGWFSAVVVAADDDADEHERPTESEYSDPHAYTQSASEDAVLTDTAVLAGGGVVFYGDTLLKRDATTHEWRVDTARANTIIPSMDACMDL